ILNGGHQLIANAGEVLSVESISGCMNNTLISDFFRKVVRDEIAPQVDAVPGMTPEAYVELIDSRFSNLEIIDTVRRVAFDGSSRQTGFVLPTLRDALAKEDAMDGLALSQAIWARMCEGTREDGTTIEPNDPIWASLNAAAKAAKSDPQAWLNQRDLYGDLAEDEALKARFHHWLPMIYSKGLEVAIYSYLQG
ncbi:MAG: mannitol dehydrogenase family protein, partial [Paracoccaceae bacterium]